MVSIHNLGFPRIGKKRELKYALEAYWANKISSQDLVATATKIRHQSHASQRHLDYVPVGDFSFYDQVLDTSFMLGHVPSRASSSEGTDLDRYFRVARGKSAGDSECGCVRACEMTKWFDTNYHYIVPELSAETRFSLNPDKLITEIREARSSGINPKPVIIGPLTYLWLCKVKDGSEPLDHLSALLPLYKSLLDRLFDEGCAWVQIDEPILVTQLDSHWADAFATSYRHLAKSPSKLLLTTYFGQLKENVSWIAKLPVDGLHVDVVRGSAELANVLANIGDEKVLSLGVIDGRNIWANDLNATLDWLEPIARARRDKLWLAPSCSLLHVPIDLASETALDQELLSWLSFAEQKLNELDILKTALTDGRTAVEPLLLKNRAAVQSRKRSERVHRRTVQQALASLGDAGDRASPFVERRKRQSTNKQISGLPLYPTTTIGSFPQTNAIRKVRRAFKQGAVSAIDYEQAIKSEIKATIRHQEDLGLDVLVHGEAERNDMVEFFGEQLCGFAFSQFGWVQSYGSRCVKPPILFGDVERTEPMTLAWTKYAQSLTDKPVKGMLTGPVTILNWSFVRDDQPRSQTCQQIAMAIRDEVLDLEDCGIAIIQVDEAALREGLPLRKSEWEHYLAWAVQAFRIAANAVGDHTQIHTHMCYSDFNDILPAIARMDADVITIETVRADKRLLDAFESFEYPNDIGPGVYDIHSPNIPTQEQMVDLIKLAARRIPAERLWINPDCGLKTRRWEEVIPALQNMVSAAKTLRKQAKSHTPLKANLIA